MQNILTVPARGRNVLDSTVDKEVLRAQYGDDERLSARQRMWQTAPSLIDRVLDAVQIPSDAAVLDVGCGNGRYLAGLRARGHTGPVFGLDYSPGMASVARSHAPVAVADAQALPVRDAVVDVAVCAHMLYHVPDVPGAIGELHRALRPGGSAVVVTNGPNHTVEADAILRRAVRDVTGQTAAFERFGARFGPDLAQSLMSAVFDRVEAHQAGIPVIVPSPDILVGYLASIAPEAAGLTEGPVWTSVLDRTSELVDEAFARPEPFVVTSDTAVFIGRRRS
jgi:SAM-dependent methyltransferase